MFILTKCDVTRDELKANIISVFIAVKIDNAVSVRLRRNVIVRIQRNG